jgi:Gpi18-like mannosyltransferase/predicted membrane-bound dolichyl-phosphate-mannose-protein mannosyltransferase
MSTTAGRTVAGARPTPRAVARPLLAILAAGFVLRLLFLPSQGFHNDVSAFEAWTLALRDNPPWLFYAKTTFADYPPGYFVVLWLLAGVYGLLGNLHLINTYDPTYFALRILVKIPALVMDLVDTAVIYAIVRRYARETIALGAAAFFAFNPATIYVSAYWGQIDCVSWGLILIALWQLLRASDDPAKAGSRIVWAWVALGSSVLMKPQGSLIAFLFVAFAFATGDALVRRRRLAATGIGIAIALFAGYLVSALFHGSLNPAGDFAWLFERYRFGSTVYPYNTVNAFNLYAVKQPFWQNDLAPLPLFGFSAGPMLVWGICLTLAATGLIVARYVQRRDDQGLLEGAMLIAFAFFTLSTRMHERYIFGAYLLAFPLIAFGRRYTWAAVALSITTFANLAYSFAYQNVMETHPPGVDATNLWPMGSHLLAVVNVIVFFAMGYVYLGGSPQVIENAERDAAALATQVWDRFDPREGLATMTRVDWLYAGLLTLASFVVCLIWIQWPGEKIFDEIYYARAGEEYLKHLEIFEFTHPPLTKLLVTASMMLFGGLHGLGDTALGWRFLNVVVGALMVGVIYLFAKRLTRSTFFSAAAAVMLLCDGFHFVQSRIATPEITVAFFSLTTLYAFYRVWTASAARRAAVLDTSRGALATAAAILIVGAIVAGGVATAAIDLGPHTRGPELRNDAWLVAFLYTELCFYLFARWLLTGGRSVVRALFGRVTPTSGSDGDPHVVSYADGSRYRYDAAGNGVLIPPEGDRIALASAKRDDVLVRNDGEAKRTYARDGRLTYVTPEATAVFDPLGRVTVDGETTGGGEMWRWVFWLSLSAGALAASKWNGLFDFFVVWVCLAGVVGQRLLRRPAVYGNPYGMPFDVVAGVMLVIAGAIYTLCYIPFFTLGHNFLDMVTLQTEMFYYHDHLVATHPYASQWWQWPILERPISYFYHDYRTGANVNAPDACCVAEILALPNPFVWLLGLVTVPLVGVLAWVQRNRGYALLVVAYLLQWLPWIGSPRIAFEYHFFPNLAIIVLCNAIVLQKLWDWPVDSPSTFSRRLTVGIYLGVVVVAFAFFYPVLVGQHVTWDAWHLRMWYPRWII